MGKGGSSKKWGLVRKLAYYVLIGIICVAFLFPIGWMISNSFKEEIDIMAYPPEFLAPPTFENYVKTVTTTPFFLYARNSLIFAGIATALGIICGVPAAFVISRSQLSGVAELVLTARMAPHISFVIPWFIMFRWLGLINTFQGLILAYLIISLPLSTWLLIGFVESIPVDFEQAALIDGCSKYTAFLRIVLPMLAPGIASAVILNFISCWNNFLLPLVLSGSHTRTLPVMIVGFIRILEVRMGGMYAVTTLTVLPVLLLAFLCQKYLLRAMVGGLK